jgi:eukaryotic-like serine/threonine-protein kinase
MVIEKVNGYHPTVTASRPPGRPDGGPSSLLREGSIVHAKNGTYKVACEFRSQGGMSKLYIVHDRNDNALLLKQLMDMSGHPPELREELTTRFMRETMVMQQLAPLKDPRFIHLVDYDPAPSPNYYIMELVPDSIDMAHAIADWGALNPALSVQVVGRTVGALYKLASLSAMRGQPLNFCHRDIKPDNILFSVPDGTIRRVVLIDLGIMRLPYSMLTALGSFRGTPGYCAPETIGASASADQRSDIFSLGCVLYFLVTGRDPFDFTTDDWAARFHDFARNAATPIRQLYAGRPSEIPVELWNTIFTALNPEPASRYPSYVDFYQALDKLAGKLSGSALPALG